MGPAAPRLVSSFRHVQRSSLAEKLSFCLPETPGVNTLSLEAGLSIKAMSWLGCTNQWVVLGHQVLSILLGELSIDSYLLSIQVMDFRPLHF